jgi:Ni,Fe-hydrogenase III large subunit
MSDKELYRQKYQAQLDEWKAEVAKLTARAAGAKADAQIEMNKHLKELEHRMRDAGDKLAELAEASEERWDSVRKNVERTWDALKAGVGAAAAKFKE